VVKRLLGGHSPSRPVRSFWLAFMSFELGSSGSRAGGRVVEGTRELSEGADASTGNGSLPR